MLIKVPLLKETSLALKKIIGCNPGMLVFMAVLTILRKFDAPFRFFLTLSKKIIYSRKIKFTTTFIDIVYSVHYMCKGTNNNKAK